MKKFSRENHIKKAEKYRDRIGDRLYHAEKVEPDKTHLIKDDIRRIKRILKLSFGNKVLDVGCSDGTVTIEIAKKRKCQEIIGVDIVSSCIKEACQKVNYLNSKLKKRIKFKKSFIEDLKFPDNYFDTIIAGETLEHVEKNQLNNVMNNLFRMLKKDGNMIITVPNRKPDKKYIKQKRDRWDWPTHYHYFTYENFKNFLERYFKRVKFYPLYKCDKVSRSIYLICNCQNKK
jgi:2-polyprenyl-3-methyl-5-hydroxy-6-metoxy-1,4-benzoquinol methylase